MKFRLLRCFAVAFVCVIETCGFSVWAEDTVVCDAGQYLDNGACKLCPLTGTNAEGKVGDAEQYPCQFVQGEDNTKCYIQKKNEPLCEDVTFVYDNTKNNYVLKEGSGVPNAYNVGYFWLDPADLDSERCGEVQGVPGYYVTQDDEERFVYTECPLSGTNAAGKVGNGDDKRFQFIEYDAGEGESVGINSCALKLDAAKDDCSNLSNVVYAYRDANTYIRIKSDVFPTTTSVVVKPLPEANVLSKEFCNACTDRLYNIGGECKECGVGYYLETQQADCTQNCEKVCILCPAGYYCDGNGNKEMCPKNTYSEGGAGESCTSCAPGYSTAQSGPAEEGYDGLCLGRNDDGYVIGCISSNACKLTMSSLSIDDGSDPFSLSTSIKIEAVNKSVVQNMN